MERSLDVSNMLEVRGCLARRLFAHPESTSQFAYGYAIWSNRLEGKAMYRPRLIVSPPGKFGVQLVDERPERAEKEQRQLESGPFDHSPILTHSVVIDNSVYHIDNAVV